MDLQRRIILYLIGVFFGSVIVYYTLFDDGRYAFNWLPNKRVTAKLAESLYPENPKNPCMANCLNMDLATLKSVISNSKIDFDNSDTQSDTRMYTCIGTHNNITYSFVVTLKNDVATISSVDGHDCNC